MAKITKVNPSQKELTPEQKVVANKILEAIKKRNKKLQDEILKDVGLK